MAQRILLVITDLKIGGTPTVVRELAARLNDPPGVVVDVACLSTRGPVAEQLESRGVRVFAMDARGPGDAVAVVRLGRLIGREKYDTVFSFLVHANSAAAVCAPFFRDVRFLQSIQTTQPSPRWHWNVQAVVHHAAELVVVPSESVAAAAESRAHVPADKITIISNAIDPAEFAGVTKAGRLASARPVPIGFIGRLDAIKRIGDLIDAIARLRGRAHLHVFGEGSERGHIEQQIARLRIQNRITLHGSVPTPQDALARVAILVLPSEAEGFGLVLIEAMAAGVPVVATDAPGIRNVVAHERTGLLVPIASPVQLAAAIERMIDDATLRARLVAAGREEVRQRFTWDAILPRYRELLRLNSPANPTVPFSEVIASQPALTTPP